jgi:hypothetical protein
MLNVDEWGDMPQRSYLWTIRLLGVVIYSLVFIFAHDFWQTGKAAVRGQPELLLFILPGVFMALVQTNSPLKSTLLMALWGSLLAALMLNSALFPSTNWLFLTAWSLSAIFWAGCGALLVRLLRIMLTLRS